MTKLLNFRIIIEQDEDNYFVASVPALPGCHTQGDTYEEALDNIKEAIALCLSEAKTNIEYRVRIAWPNEEKTNRFLGVTNLTVTSPIFS